MRVPASSVLVLIVALAGCAPPAAEQSVELAETTAAWEAAFDAGNIDALVELYSEDARLMPPNGQATLGRDAVEAAFSGMLEAGLGLDLQTVDTLAAGDLAYRVGTFTMAAPDGSPVDQGKFIEVWRQIDGAWQMTNDIWNSDLPAGPAGAIMVGVHEVGDPETWLAAWLGEGSRHELFAAHGVPKVRVMQSPDDPNLTGLVLEVADPEAMMAMLASEEGQAAAAEDTVKFSTLRMLAEVE